METKLYAIALEAIKKLFGDTSATASQTAEDLQSLMEEIAQMLETLNPKG